MRLVTRGDLDGLACSTIATALDDEIEEVVLVHPQDITDKKVEISSADMLANLPYHPDCGEWFDHHELTESNEKPPEDFVGRHEIVDSAAQLIWEHYGSDPRFAELVRETNRLDAAKLGVLDVLHPKGFILLGFTIDGRTGLGSFNDYFMRCMGWLQTMPIEEILAQTEVVERVERLQKEHKEFHQLIREHSEQRGNVIYSDFRSCEQPPAGNRFLVFAIFPEANVALRVQWGPGRSIVAATVGHSIFNRTCKTHVADLMSRYGGGGHARAGATPLPVDRADELIEEILGELSDSEA